MTTEPPLYGVGQPREAPLLDMVLQWLDRPHDRAPTFPPRAQQVDHLRRHAHALLDLDTDADRVVQACGEPGPVPGSVGRQGGTLMVRYFRWREDFTPLPIEPHLQFFHDELLTAADYRHGLVRAALQLAFSNDPRQRSRTGRSTLAGLGEAHHQLSRLVDQLAQL